ncbi:hypothetical protein RI129_007436 [Pyrocoelia pectoralis]|uniref:C2 domain-containing protein n=1 Tax=Pyrocoelia pectoralis TaxID=417401 RepID=A0AAN7VEF6_9COLE
MSENAEILSARRATLVEQILEQGQRLRNAMVKSILDNDPFYIDAVDANKIKNSLKTTAHSNVIKNPRETVEKILGTNSNAKMSAEIPNVYCGCEICNIYKREISHSTKCQHIPPLHLLDRVKNKVHNSNGNGYDSEATDSTIRRLNLQNDGLRSGYSENKSHSEIQNPSEEITRSIQESYRSKAVEYFKYIDSMKILIHNLSLNPAGNKKALISSVDSKYRLPTSISHSYFVEYSIPDCLSNTSTMKSKSKVDSGLSPNLFRICSKKIQNEEIYFKHSSIHDIANLLQFNLKTIDIKFQVSSRTMKQKRANVLGSATFNMSLFEITKNVSYTDDFPIISEDFVLGTVKITLQLGCGRMYFGKEFVEFIDTNRKNSYSTVTQNTSTLNTPSTQTVHSVIYQSKVKEDTNKYVDNLCTAPPKPKPFLQGNVCKETFFDNGFASSTGTMRSEVKSIKDNEHLYGSQKNATLELSDVNQKIILYGLLYVSEAKYFEGPVNSYLSSQAFSLGDTLSSRVVYNSKDPVFNFYQKVPFLYDESFLKYLQSSSIVIDFWQRCDDEDVTIGTSQLSLYQFYVNYRNRVITNTLIQNQLPVTIADWWEPICSPINGKLYGQMKVLIAVGTATQIQNLEIERGLKDESLSVTYVPIVPETSSEKQIITETRKTDEVVNQKPPLLKKSNCTKKPLKDKDKKSLDVAVTNNNTKSPKAPPLLNNVPSVNIKNDSSKVVDKGVQSDINMESHVEEKNSNNTQNLLEAFLTQLLEQKQKNKFVENATNTDIDNSKITANKEANTEVVNNVSVISKCPTTELRKTSDLLDYLKDSLSLDSLTLDKKSLQSQNINDEDSFKACVIIEGALHLPCQRKCKVKKSRRKSPGTEESLPSTYVTFETVPGADLKVTPVVCLSANPHWDYKCDVSLPGDVLTSNQKRLIFKVWRKSNSNAPQPNLQTDVILGFAALDLTVLMAGLPSVQGWFNIVDFSSKCNGQIKIHITPLENISRFMNVKNIPSSYEVDSPDCSDNKPFKSNRSVVPSALLDIGEPPGELLSRALKRKFTELEEITQRLRTRLADVTKDDSDVSNDEFADEFERDINTLSVEEDYNMLDLSSSERNSDLHLQSFSRMENDVNNYLLKEVKSTDRCSAPSIYSKGIFQSESFPKGALSDSAYGGSVSQRYADSPNVLDTLDINYSSQLLTPRDKQLIAGKQQINTLLEKLSLLTGSSTDNVFPSRYVSGCSVNQENDVPTHINKPSNKLTQPASGFNLDSILNPELFDRLCSDDTSATSLTETNITEANDSSTTSILTQCSNLRQAPDGAGNYNTSISSISNSLNLN